MQRIPLSSALVSVAVSMLSLAGCAGGASPEIYAVAVDYFRPADSCYADARPPAQVTTASTQASAQLQVWDGPQNTAFLEIAQGAREIDMGTAPNVSFEGVLEGAREGSQHVFSATRSSVTTVPPPLASKVTETTKLTLTFPRGGGPISGTMSLESSRTCEGSACLPNFAALNPPCNLSDIAFRGTRLAVEFERAP